MVSGSWLKVRGERGVKASIPLTSEILLILNDVPPTFWAKADSGSAAGFGVVFGSAPCCRQTVAKSTKSAAVKPCFVGQLGVVWVIFGAFGARKGDKTSRGAGCEPYSSRPPAVEGSFDLRPPGSAL